MNQPRKLSLSKTTLRSLSQSELRQAAGGSTQHWWESCAESACSGCHLCPSYWTDCNTEGSCLGC